MEFAITGIVTAFKEERNIRKHMVSAILATAAGAVFRISAMEWLFLFLAIFLVITLEMINSAIENVVDLASDYHFSMLAKNAKDMAAGAVLVVSTYAVITGLIYFCNRKIIAFYFWQSNKNILQIMKGVGTFNVLYILCLNQVL